MASFFKNCGKNFHQFCQPTSGGWMQQRKTGAVRFVAFAGLEPADPDRPFLAANLCH